MQSKSRSEVLEDRLTDFLEDENYEGQIQLTLYGSEKKKVLKSYPHTIKLLSSELVIMSGNRRMYRCVFQKK